MELGKKRRERRVAWFDCGLFGYLNAGVYFRIFPYSFSLLFRTILNLGKQKPSLLCHLMDVRDCCDFFGAEDDLRRQVNC